MAPRGRSKKVGQRRIDAAIDTLEPLGFSRNLICRTVKSLLKVYGGVEGEGWVFIEEASYKLVIETILEEQEKCLAKKDNACDEGRRTIEVTEPLAIAPTSKVAEEASAVPEVVGLLSGPGSLGDISWRDISCIDRGVTLEQNERVEHTIVCKSQQLKEGSGTAPTYVQHTQAQHFDTPSLPMPRQIHESSRRDISCMDCGVKLEQNERVEHAIGCKSQQLKEGSGTAPTYAQHINTQIQHFDTPSLPMRRQIRESDAAATNYVQPLSTPSIRRRRQIHESSRRDISCMDHGVKLEQNERLEHAIACKNQQVKEGSGTAPTYAQHINTQIQHFGTPLPMRRQIRESDAAATNYVQPLSTPSIRRRRQIHESSRRDISCMDRGVKLEQNERVEHAIACKNQQVKEGSGTAPTYAQHINTQIQHFDTPSLPMRRQIRESDAAATNYVQPLSTPSIRRRRHCFGWISDDDEEETTLIGTSACGAEIVHSMSVLDQKRRRKTRWDVKPVPY